MSYIRIHWVIKKIKKKTKTSFGRIYRDWNPHMYLKSTKQRGTKLKDQARAWSRRGVGVGEAKGRLRRMRKRIRLGNGASWTKCSSALVSSAVYSSISSATMATRIIFLFLLCPAKLANEIFFSSLPNRDDQDETSLSIYMELPWGLWRRYG